MFFDQCFCKPKSPRNSDQPCASQRLGKHPKRRYIFGMKIYENLTITSKWVMIPVFRIILGPIWENQRMIKGYHLQNSHFWAPNPSTIFLGLFGVVWDCLGLFGIVWGSIVKPGNGWTWVYNLMIRNLQPNMGLTIVDPFKNICSSGGSQHQTVGTSTSHANAMQGMHHERRRGTMNHNKTIKPKISQIDEKKPWFHCFGDVSLLEPLAGGVWTVSKVPVAGKQTMVICQGPRKCKWISKRRKISNIGIDFKTT